MIKTLQLVFLSLATSLFLLECAQKPTVSSKDEQGQSIQLDPETISAIEEINRLYGSTPIGFFEKMSFEDRKAMLESPRTESKPEPRWLGNINVTRMIANAPKMYRTRKSGVVFLTTNKMERRGAGSIVSQEGEIISNWHVVKEDDKMLVYLYDSEATTLGELKNHAIADVIASDPKRDLALLKLRKGTIQVSPLHFGNDNDLNVAQEVFTIGHPKSLWIFNQGYIGQLHRNYEWSYNETNWHQADIIEIQIPFNPGNSGGPLFNENGELIGINCFGDPEINGLNYAIRVNVINQFLGEARAGKHSH